MILAKVRAVVAVDGITEVVGAQRLSMIDTHIHRSNNKSEGKRFSSSEIRKERNESCNMQKRENVEQKEFHSRTTSKKPNWMRTNQQNCLKMNICA
mmetsp:Transcript_39287/g.45855  ORF Transcript_39287/g.45855 Transcript_39287/m.45855 type:complete len:96 (+) Transcript_39287:226-513(+)